MRFTYTLDGTGWATASLGDTRSEITMTVFYLHDSLTQLTNAVLELQAGQTEQVVVFMDEPGEHQVVFRALADGAVLVQARWLKDWASWKMHTAEDYEVVFESLSTLPEIHTLVTTALRRIFDEYGLRGYKKVWTEHEFPIDEYQKLLRA